MKEPMKRTRSPISSAVQIALLAGTPGGVALAQDTSYEDLAIDEIVVTSRKREETVVEIPMNIATVNSEEILARNLRTPYGEIDLVAQTEGSLVFVEVKTRSTDDYGHPETSITPQKREHLIASAQAYMQESPDPVSNWRIDVIAIRKLKSTSPPEIIHFENAIT